MGNQHSSTPLLVPHAAFPPVLSRVCTRQRLVRLQLHTGFWSHCQLEPMEIRDATTNLTMFRVPTSLRSKNGSKRLLDMYNAPVATLQIQSQTHSTTTFAMNPARPDYDSKPVLCKVQVNPTPTVSASICGNTNSNTTGFRITCEGDWTSHHCDFWMESHCEGHTVTPLSTRARIATVRRQDLPSDRKRRRYAVEIAAGVDVALVLLICVAMDEATTKYFDVTTPFTKESLTKSLEPRPKAIQIPVWSAH